MTYTPYADWQNMQCVTNLLFAWNMERAKEVLERDGIGLEHFYEVAGKIVRVCGLPYVSEN